MNRNGWKVLGAGVVVTEKIMTKKPITVDSKMNIKDAINIMNSNKITAVFVVKKNSKVPEGILHIHDCIKIG